MSRPALLPRSAIPWEQAITLAVACVIGVYAGLAAGLFAQCIRAATILLYRMPELVGGSSAAGDAWPHRFLQQVLHARWHFEFALLASLVFVAAWVVERMAAGRRLHLPLFEARRLRAVAFVGAFGLVLYFPLVLLAAFTGVFAPTEGGLFAELVRAPLLLRLLAPAAGALAAGLVVRYVSPESAGHGVGEVLEAVHGDSRQLRGNIAIWKSIAAGLTIGSGGSAGREGPVVHLGGAVASALARFLELPRERAALLLACGAGAGIAASFQAPLGGAMFAMEIVLAGSFGARNFAPVVLSSVLATVTSRALSSGGADLHATGWALEHPVEIAFYLALGVLAGTCGLVYVRLIDGVHALFDGHAGGFLGERLARLPGAVKPALGGLCVGAAGLLAPRALGAGIESMNAALAGQLTLLSLLFALGVKLLATALTLGSGAPGGSFFPAVFCGAMLGGAFGLLAHHLFPAIATRPEAYAAVGMGAVVAAAASAPLTGALLMFELTGNTQIVLPLLVACGIAAACMHLWLGGSVYALKLQAKGIVIDGRDEVLRSLSVAQAMERVAPIADTLPWSELLALLSRTLHSAFPVQDERGRLIGLLPVRSVRAGLLREAANAGTLCQRAPVRVAYDEDLEDALRRLDAAQALEAVVLDGSGEQPLGVLTRAAVLESWRRAR